MRNISKKYSTSDQRKNVALQQLSSHNLDITFPCLNKNRICEYFEILLDSLVGDTGLCLCLSHHVVKILLKVLSLFDQMHGHIIVCGTLSQTRKEGPGII